MAGEFKKIFFPKKNMEQNLSISFHRGGFQTTTSNNSLIKNMSQQQGQDQEQPNTVEQQDTVPTLQAAVQNPQPAVTPIQQDVVPQVDNFELPYTFGARKVLGDPDELLKL